MQRNIRRVKEAPRTATQSSTILVRTLLVGIVMKIAHRRGYDPEELRIKSQVIEARLSII